MTRRMYGVSCEGVSDDDYENFMEDGENSKNGMQRLTDLAAKVTGKYLGCADIEKHPAPVEDFLLKKVAYHAFPQDLDTVKAYATLKAGNDLWVKAEELLDEGAITNIHQVGFLLAAVFSTKDAHSGIAREDTKVSLTFEKHQLTSATCMMCPDHLMCVHVIAAIQYRIKFADEVSCHAPMTDTLSVLTREQLQKLVQFAVNEDPAGMLGRVYTHYDAVRDPTSELSKELGAPDPTFNSEEYQETLHRVSLKQFTQTMEEHIMCSTIPTWANTEQIDKGNLFVDFENSYIYRDLYLKHVRRFCVLHEIQSAATILLTLVKCFAGKFHFGPDGNGVKNTETLKMRLADLERIVTCFILTYKDTETVQLVEMATSLNSIIGALGARVSYIPNEWVHIAAIRLQKRQLEGNVNVPEEKENVISLCQPIYASFLPNPRTSFDKLVNGFETPLSMSYDEPLNVMLLRFDAISLFKEGHLADQQLCRLGIIILHKLLKLSKKYSILCGGKHDDTSSIDAKTNITDCSCPEGPSPPKKPHLEHHDPGGPKCHGLPKSEIETQDISYSKGQVSFSLVYVCDKLYKIKDVLSILSKEQFVLLNATLRAIEMGRFRDKLLDENVIVANEYILLEKMESKILKTIVKLGRIGYIPGTSQIYNVVLIYASALEEYGMSFYEDTLALSLVYTLVKLDEAGNRIDLSLSVKAFLAWDWPLTYADNLPREKWKYLLDNILERCITDSTLMTQEPVEQVLKHIADIKDGQLAHVLLFESSCAQHFKSYPLKLKTFFMQSLLQSLTPREGSKIVHECTRQKKEMFVEYAKYLKAREYLEFILPSWNTLRDYDDEGCFDFIEDVCKALITQPDQNKDSLELASTKDALFTYEDVAMCKDLILGFFNAKNMHTEECCFFLQYFLEEVDRMELLKAISTNSANFSVDSLMQFAKMEHRFNVFCSKNKKLSSTSSVISTNQNTDAITRKNTTHTSEQLEILGTNTPPMTFSETVVSLIKCMFYNVRSTEQSITDCEYIGYHIEWCVDKITYEPCDRQIEIFIKELHRSISKLQNKHLIIVYVLKALSKMRDRKMWRMARELLTDHLLEGYFEHFEGRIKTISRPRSTIYDLERDISHALYDCVEHVDQGRDLFINNIVTPLKAKYKRKRNFCKAFDGVLKQQQKHNVLTSSDSSTSS